jgi:hypothetical protein
MPVLVALFLSLSAAAQSPAGKLWSDLKARRDALPGVHQEFEVSQTYELPSRTHSSKRQLVLDMSGRQWREESGSGSGARVRIFDGTDLYSLEQGGDEFVRPKRRAKDGDPAPDPYSVDAEWSKATEAERRPCGIAGNDHLCAILSAPLKPWFRCNGNDGLRMLNGAARLLVDTETGLLVSMATVETIERKRDRYQVRFRYASKSAEHGAAPEAALFALPASGPHEVRELSRWNAAKIQKRLAGKPAPELVLSDIQGKAIRIAEFRAAGLLDNVVPALPRGRSRA